MQNRVRKGKNFIKYVNRLREKDKEAGSLGSLKTKIKKRSAFGEKKLGNKTQNRAEMCSGD